MRFTIHLITNSIKNIMYPYSFAFVSDKFSYAVLYGTADSAIMNLINKYPINDVKTNKEVRHKANIQDVRVKLTKVSDILKEYCINGFVVSEGASITRNDGSEKVKRARDIQIAWENENNEDPNEDWSISYSDAFDDVLSVVNSFSKKERSALFNGRYKNSPYTIFRRCALVGKVPASYIEVYELPSEKGIGYIGIGTNPKYRHMGLSIGLVKAAEELNKIDHKVKYFYWEAHKWNKPSQELAKKLGYKKFLENKESVFFKKEF